MTTTLAVIGVIETLSFCLVILCMRHAPDGFETGRGFVYFTSDDGTGWGC